MEICEAMLKQPKSHSNISYCLWRINFLVKNGQLDRCSCKCLNVSVSESVCEYGAMRSETCARVCAGVGKQRMICFRMFLFVHLH